MNEAFIFIFGIIVTTVALGPLLYAAVVEYTEKRGK